MAGAERNQLRLRPLNAGRSRITYTAHDGYGGSASRSFILRGKQSKTRRVDENSPPGTNVGSPVTGNPLPDETLTYSLTSDDPDTLATFTIDPATGRIKVASGATLDHESRATYSLTVTLTDGDGGTSTENIEAVATIAVTINVTDVNEPPDPPDAPTLTEPATNAETTLDVSWTAPDMTGKPAITNYDVWYRVPGTASFTPAGYDAHRLAARHDLRGAGPRHQRRGHEPLVGRGRRHDRSDGQRRPGCPLHADAGVHTGATGATDAADSPHASA